MDICPSFLEVGSRHPSSYDGAGLGVLQEGAISYHLFCTATVLQKSPARSRLFSSLGSVQTSYIIKHGMSMVQIFVGSADPWPF